MAESYRIAYRGNFSRPFCTEVHVAASLEALGHDVVRLQENETTWARCVDEAKRSHLFLWTKTWIIEPEQGHAALDELRSVGVPSVSFHLDRYIGLDREAQIPEDPFWRTDFVFTADGGSQAKFEEYGVNHFWMPPGMYDAEARIGKRNPRFPHPVVFVGSHPYPHKEWAEYRAELLDRVGRHFGRRFAIWPKPRQPIRNRELSDLYASALVVIGDSCLAGGSVRYWSDRVPETLGRGGLLIHPKVEGMGDWYDADGGDFLGYDLGDFDRVIELAEWALTHGAEAELVRTRGQRTVLERDTYRHRMVEVIATVKEHHGFPVVEEVPETHMARHRAMPRPTPIHYRAGHPGDLMTIQEVWRDDQYTITKRDVAGMAVVDVGGNIGAFTVLAAAAGARSVHVWEPDPGNAAILRANAARWSSVVVHEEALLDCNDEGVVLVSGHGGDSSGTHVDRTILRSEDTGTATCRTRDVNKALSPLGRIDLLKLDCEGAEYPIVAAIDDEILRGIRRIVGEWHGPRMPHLADWWETDDEFVAEWGAFVAKLADFGHLELHGHPTRGGVFNWTRY